MKTTIILLIGLALATTASAQAARYSFAPDANGGVWIFDTIRGTVSKCVRPEPEPSDGAQSRVASPWEFYEDGDDTAPFCSDWTTLSDIVEE